MASELQIALHRFYYNYPSNQNNSSQNTVYLSSNQTEYFMVDGWIMYVMLFSACMWCCLVQYNLFSNYDERS